MNFFSNHLFFRAVVILTLFVSLGIGFPGFSWAGDDDEFEFTVYHPTNVFENNKEKIRLWGEYRWKSYNLRKEYKQKKKDAIKRLDEEYKKSVSGVDDAPLKRQEKRTYKAKKAETRADWDSRRNKALQELKDTYMRAQELREQVYREGQVPTN